VYRPRAQWSSLAVSRRCTSPGRVLPRGKPPEAPDFRHVSLQLQDDAYCSSAVTSAIAPAGGSWSTALYTRQTRPIARPIASRPPADVAPAPPGSTFTVGPFRRAGSVLFLASCEHLANEATHG
jgi:hypothetical protein